ncbi:MAG: hypothetical protein H0W84_01345 [Bacteroidetes bacterium]|nr:hypothetical protein [Bacteroidota bacterium]
METSRLEYNEYQGRFHLNKGGIEPNTNYWFTICNNLSYEQCMEFSELMTEKYDLMGQNKNDYPSFELIQSEFVKFLLS